MKSASVQGLQHMSRPVAPSDIQQYTFCPTQNSGYSPEFNGVWSHQHSDAYLTPISVIPVTSVSNDSTKAFSAVSEHQKASLNRTGDTSGLVYMDSINALPSSVPVIPETDSAATAVTPISSLISGPTTVTTIPPNLPIPAYSHVPHSTVSSCQTQPPFSTHFTNATSQYSSLSSTSSISSCTAVTDSKPASDTSSSSYSVDESLYEISEEEMREIDASLTNNPDVMASRQWKYYTETNEWTRATCALMACLFTRDQMANSTVLGRGGSQRARLPSNLVAYVVGTIRKRFNKPAAAVRARMAQKCKDERRFGRLTVTGSGSVYAIDSHEAGTPVPVAAISGKSGLSRKARKRPAPGTGLNNSLSRATKSSNSSTPPSDYASTPGYQPTAYNDDACSSTTDSNQLPPLALSPSGDYDSDLFGKSEDSSVHLAPINPQLGHYPQSTAAHALSMMLLVPESDGPPSSTQGSNNDPVVLSNHVPASAELAS